MRCLVTGGAGFIGSHAVRQMIAEGWEVAVLTRPGESTRRLREFSSQLTIVEARLAELDRIRPFLAAWAPDAALHCAWYAEPGLYLDSARNIDCLRDSLGLLELLIESGCKSAVMVGTCAEYAADSQALNESSAVGPATLYAAAKLATWLVAEKRAQQAGLSLAWARLFYLFGPEEDRRRVVPSLICSLLSGREFEATMGEQTRDYLYVEDAAAGLVTLVKNAANGVFNVCSGEAVRIRDLMQMAGDLAGRPELIRFGALPYRALDPPVVRGDSSRLRSLGWRPRRDLLAALKMTVEYWREVETRSADS